LAYQKDLGCFAGFRAELARHDRTIAAMEDRITDLNRQLNIVDKELHGAIVRMQTIGGTLGGALIVIQLFQFMEGR